MNTAQRHTLDVLARTALSLVRQLRGKFPYEEAWTNLCKSWNKKVLLGAHTNHASFSHEYGCLLVGVPEDGGHIPLLTTRMFLALTRGATGSKTCTTLHSTMLGEAKSMNIALELHCNDILEHGMIDTTWNTQQCSSERSSWPELLGVDVRTAEKYLRAARPGFTIQPSPWDSMHYKPAAPDVIRLTYDTKTNIVVNPAPHLGVVNIPAVDGECFATPDKGSGVKCVGAPSNAPAEWQQFIGKSLIDVIDTLRFTYPHATVEALPSTAAVSADIRPDRIRVRFHPDTGIVNVSPMIG